MMDLDYNLENRLVPPKDESLIVSKRLSLQRFKQESQSTSSDNDNFNVGKPHDSACDKLAWDIEKSSPNIVVFNHGHTARRRKCKDSTDLVRTRQPLGPGLHHILLSFNEKPWGSHCAVGLVMRGAKRHMDGYGHLMGQDEKSWCLDIPSGKVMHNGSVRPGYSLPGPSEEIGRRIMIIVDTKRGTLSYVVSNKALGIAYTNLSELEVYPAVSMVYGRQEVTLTHTVIPSEESDSTIEPSESESSLTRPSNNASPEPSVDYSTLLQVDELSEEQQAVLQIAHGWNEKKMGEKLCGVMPNAPNVCYPPKPTFSVAFPYRQQAIVSRRGFSKGRYVWQITEDVINHFLMRGGPENMPLKQNDVIIGVATENFQSFMNAGIPLKWDYGRDFWGWKVSDSCLVYRRRRTSHRYPQGKAKIDLKQGVEVILDCETHTLSFASGRENLGVAFRRLPHDVALYPAIIFDGYSWFPVRLEIVKVPQQYMEDFLTEAETSSLDKEEYLEMIGFHTLDEVSKRDDQVEATRIMRSKFGWYMHGQPEFVRVENFQSNSNEGVFHTLSVQKPDNLPSEEPMNVVVFSEYGLTFSGRHVIYFNLPSIEQGDNYRIGFVDSTYVELWEELNSTDPNCQLTDQQKSVIEKVMLNHYWAWDMLEHKLYHAGKRISNYPVVGFNAFKFKHYQLVVDIRKVITVSLFAADCETGDDLDLGIMVTNLTDRRPVYPMLHFLKGASPCRLMYMEGPKAYVDEFGRARSGFCSIL